jgi:two-component system chemotaxis response regulator CheB
MPRNALAHVNVDFSLPLADIPAVLVRLTSAALPAAEAAIAADTPLSPSLEVEVKIAKEHHPVEAGLEKIAEPSAYACPECHGVLLQLKEGDRMRFRCHTGHAYSIESLLAAVSEGIEEALWISIRALEEASLLLTGMAAHLTTSHNGDVDALLSQAKEVRRQSEAIRKLASDREPLTAKR